MEQSQEHLNFLERLSRMKSEEILSTIAEAKTGRRDYANYLPLEASAQATGALSFFIAALEQYRTNKLIDDALKQD